ncbi:hypothetical protein ASD37_25680 [Mycobacterium sp. Root135]|uniref:beta-propeller fold lactonase family protein n=1 Tax=Mycobacterium sp. Root135 TaxID=1736457 RepID=UPI000701B0AC|nr:beta-propeller fold lactonase family protein [Mycobacterium sp. Root135]KQY02941.1 hypothetical protein ASD37_25680 [Mycobacterium sp. Root135]
MALAEVTVTPRPLVARLAPTDTNTVGDTTTTLRSALEAPALPVPTVTPPTPLETVLAVPGTIVSTLLNLFTQALAPLIGPGAPADNPVLWGVLAFVRRQFDMTTNTLTAASVSTSQRLDTALATAATANQPPTVVAATLGTPDPTTGAVSGHLNATDPENRKLSYTVATAPSTGVLTLNKTTGAFTYTPTASQRVLAGLAGGTAAASFAVTVSDGTNKPAATVTVPISPTTVTGLGSVAAGDGTSGLAATNTRAYVTNYDAGTLTVIDTIHRTVVATIDVDNLPSGVTVTPDGSKVYVTSQDTNTVSVINGATNTVTAQIHLGAATPQAIATSRDGKTLYVTTTTYTPDPDFPDTIFPTSTITKISTTTNKVSGTIKNVGLVPYGLTVSPDGKKVYVVSEVFSDDGTYQTGAFVFASGASTATAINGVGHRPQSVTISPDGKSAYIADRDSGTISIVETSKYTVTHTISTAPDSVDAVAVNRDGSLLIVLNAATHNVDVYTTTGTYALLTSVPTTATTDLNFPQAVLSTDGQQLYYTSDAALQVISLVPANTFPIAGAPVLNPPTATGVVSGSVPVTDPDQDTLTYRASAPGKGSVVVNPDGTFTYTPTAAARHAAATVGASAALTTDTFTLTADDGRRGIITVPVTVNILPANTAPTAKASVGSPNFKTGIVTGSVTGADKDKDALTYTSTAPAKGTVTIDAKGKFTYTPTASARQAAAAPAAAAVDKADAFTINVDDGHGGIFASAVTVKISPLSTAQFNLIAVESGFAAINATTSPAPVVAAPQAALAAAQSTASTNPTVAATIPTMPAPEGVAISPDGSRVYVAHSSHNGAVTVIDTATNTVTATIPVGDGPIGVAISPNGSRLYVSNTVDGTVSVINTATNTVIGKAIAVGSKPFIMAVSPNGSRVYVTNTGDGTVSVINTATNTVIGNPIFVGSDLYHVAISPNGSRLYVSRLETNAVSVIDTSTNTVIGNPIPVGKRPFDVAVSPDGSRVYVTNGNDGTVSVIDTATNTVTGSPIFINNNGVYGLGVSPNGSRIYVTTYAGRGTVSVVDTATNTVIGSPLPVGSFSRFVTVSPNGSRAYVTNVYGNSVSVIDTGQQALGPGGKMLATVYGKVQNPIRKQQSESVTTALQNRLSLTASQLFEGMDPNVSDKVTVQLVRSIDGKSYRMMVYMTGIDPGNPFSVADAAYGNTGLLNRSVSDFIDNAYDKWSAKKKIQGITLVGFSDGGQQMQNYAGTGAHAGLVNNLVLYGAPLIKTTKDIKGKSSLAFASGDDLVVTGGSHHDAFDSYNASGSDKYAIYATNGPHNQQTYKDAAKDFDDTFKYASTEYVQIAKAWQPFKGTVVDSGSFRTHYIGPLGIPL